MCGLGCGGGSGSGGGFIYLYYYLIIFGFCRQRDDPTGCSGVYDQSI